MIVIQQQQSLFSPKLIGNITVLTESEILHSKEKYILAFLDT